MSEKDFTKDQKEAARDHLLKAKMYKIVSIGLLITAFMVAFMVYGVLANGDALTFIKQPLVGVAMLIPFLPAYVFAMMSKGQRNKAVNALKNAGFVQSFEGKK